MSARSSPAPARANFMPPASATPWLYAYRDLFFFATVFMMILCCAETPIAEHQAAATNMMPIPELERAIDSIHHQLVCWTIVVAAGLVVEYAMDIIRVSKTHLKVAAMRRSAATTE